MNKKTDVFQLTILSMLLAILIAQTFIPMLGYIPLGPIDVTIVHITVILAAVLFGKKTGSIIGLAWGLLSMLRAYMQPTPFNVVFLNPLISVVPRLIVGWISAVVFIFLSEKISDKISYAITAAIGTFANTFFVLGGIYLFASEAYAKALGIQESVLLGALGTIVATNGVIEIIASVIILPLVALPLKKVINRRTPSL
ncbi:MAG TPA: ECF transporter S component [Candidatus Atopostipes pullistercoris]|uniref:ECF transporter S component n=1 Tax=Candidatus Atopostipes pullistercoris TaxID=2838467 RepID=A0A9D2G1U6_9LACT|nr:ECF transporter S component [Candidatus Atopostipes pullistercoris]